MRQIQPELFNSMQMNEKPNKNYVLRQKLIMTHFTDSCRFVVVVESFWKMFGI